MNTVALYPRVYITTGIVIFFYAILGSFSRNSIGIYPFISSNYFGDISHSLDSYVIVARINGALHEVSAEDLLWKNDQLGREIFLHAENSLAAHTNDVYWIRRIENMMLPVVKVYLLQKRIGETEGDHFNVSTRTVATYKRP